MILWEKHLQYLNNLSEDKIIKILLNKWDRMNNLYSIVNKQGKLIRFDMNEHQYRIKDVIQSGKNPMVLKARQTGVTTFQCIFNLDEAIFNKDIRCGIIAHKRDNLDSIFRIIKIAFKNLPDFLNLSKDIIHNKKELYIKENGSLIGTFLEARSLALTHCHFSEYAFSEKERIDATFGALSPDSFISIESTPNGLNHFYDFYNEDHNVFEKIFIPWFDEKGYKIPLINDIHLTDEEEKLNISKEQINFRRETIKRLGKRMFFQEFPENEIDCFLSSGAGVLDLKNLMYQMDNRVSEKKYYIKDDMHIRIYNDLREKDRYYYIGVDASEGLGKDFTGIQVISEGNDKKLRHDASIYGQIITINLCKFICDFTKDNFEFYPHLIVERNNHGHAIIQGLLFNDECLYKGVMYYSIKDKRAGFLTTRHSKRNMQRELLSDIDNNDIMINDKRTLKELSTLVLNDAGNIEAEEGKHDDMVISLGLAHHFATIYRKGMNLDYTISDV